MQLFTCYARSNLTKVIQKKISFIWLIINFFFSPVPGEGTPICFSLKTWRRTAEREISDGGFVSLSIIKLQIPGSWFLLTWGCCLVSSSQSISPITPAPRGATTSPGLKTNNKNSDKYFVYCISLWLRYNTSLKMAVGLSNLLHTSATILYKQNRLSHQVKSTLLLICVTYYDRFLFHKNLIKQ